MKKKIRLIKAFHNWTNKDLAKVLGLHEMTVIQYQREVWSPKKLTLEKIDELYEEVKNGL